ncbi:MAG: cyanophycinase [Bacteroidota bacterium]|nr:cyanophycinase [Bacteroidota bacterium]
MKKVVSVIHIVVLIVVLTINSSAKGQDVQLGPKLFIGGGALPESMYKEFCKLTGPETKLVVIPTASKDDPDVEKIKELWQSRGIGEVIVLHTKDREVASSPGFTEPLITATAVWFSGGSQQRITDAYIGTLVEEELYRLLERGGIIGGSSAGAAIQSRVMIKGGKSQPEISTGLKLMPGAIIDQHFLKRNRLSRLIAAVRTHPGLIGFGIDEGTAILVYDNEYRIVGQSYVLRVELIEGAIKIDAFEDGDIIPMVDS